MKKLLIIAAALGLAGLVWAIAAPAGPKAPTAPAATPAVKTAEQAKPAPAAAGPSPAGVPVLMYHKVGDEKNNDAVISPARFAEQMEYLHKNGYRPLSLGELEAYLGGRGQLPAKPVVITFDDGYRDTYEIALPILKKYGFKSTLFIITGDKERRLSWQELREMKAAGMEIGAHTVTHRELGGMPAAEQAAEIARSKEAIDRNLGQDTRYFCYPNGSYDGTTFKLLREHGFTVAVTINAGWVKRGDDPLTLRRVWMGNAVDLKNFEARLTRENYPIL